MYNYFDRAAVKQRAKQALKKCYWLAFGVAAIVSLIMGELPGFSFNIDLSGSEAERFDSAMPFIEQAPAFGQGGDLGVPALLGIGITMLVLVILVSVLAVTLVKSFFLDGAVAVGSSRFFLAVTRGEAKFSDALAGFQKNYFNICKVMFNRMLRLMLWELFILIPLFTAILGGVLAGIGFELAGMMMALLSLFGIFPAMIPYFIKYYEYSMIPYLLAEHPNMTAKAAFAASRELTEGHKGALFTLDLSFIGWEILGVLCLGIGGMFLEPYIRASWAEGYAELCRLRYPPAPTPFEPTSTTPVMEEPADDIATETQQPNIEDVEHNQTEE